MTEIEAYPCGRTYEQRQATDYEPLDCVTIGPAFADGSYRTDEWSGAWYVVCFEGNDYHSLSRTHGGDHELYMSTTRLTRAQTLNERLTELGFTTRQAGGYAHDILTSDGTVVFTGTAHEVTDWVREGCAS